MSEWLTAGLIWFVASVAWGILAGGFLKEGAGGEPELPTPANDRGE